MIYDNFARISNVNDLDFSSRSSRHHLCYQAQVYTPKKQLTPLKNYRSFIFNMKSLKPF